MAKLPKSVESLLSSLEPTIREAFQAWVRSLEVRSLKALTDAIRAGDIDRAVALLNLDAGNTDQLRSALREAYVKSGEAALAEVKIPAGAVPPGVSASLGFDATATGATDWMRQHFENFRASITEDQKLMARNVMADGLAKGTHPRTIALDLTGRKDPLSGRRTGGFIGLTDPQREFAENALNELTTGGNRNLRNYLDRAARNKRYDKAVQRAIDTGKPLPKDIAEKAVAAYKDNLLKLRGRAIARSEAITSLRASRHESFSQLSKKVSPDRITRTWQSTGDAKTRDSHMAMNGQERVGLDTPFDFPSGGQAMFPGDTSLGAPARETVMCRCFEKVFVKFVNQRKRDGTV